MVDEGRALQRLPSHAVGHDLVDLVRWIAQRAQGLGNALVDDLEVAAPRQLLELDEGEVGLDARGVAVHDEPDGARGRQYRHLGVAIAVLLPELEGAVPGRPRGLEKCLRAVLGVDAERGDGQPFVVAGGGIVGRPPVVADDPQHGQPVLLEAGEGPEVLGHPGRGRVGLAVHDRRQRPADGHALGRVIGDAAAHEHGAHVGVAEPQRPEVPALLGDGGARVGAHEHADLEHHRP